MGRAIIVIGKGAGGAGGGTIAGSIAATQVAYGSAANTIKGDAAYTFTEGTGVLKLGVTGSSANSVSITGASTGALSLAAAGTNQPITLTPSGTGNVQTINGTAAAPSYSFISDTGTGWFRTGAGNAGYSSNGTLSFIVSNGGTLYNSAADTLLQLAANGAVSLQAGGTNKSITLTPSGSGVVQLVGGTNVNWGVSGNAGIMGNNAGGSSSFLRFVVGGGEVARFAVSGNLLLSSLSTDGTGVLQFPAATTSAGGITFGTDVNFYRIAANRAGVNGTGATVELDLLIAGSAVATWRNDGANTILAGINNSLILQSANTTALTLDSSQNQQNAGTINHAGQKVVSTQYDTINTTLATVTGLSVTVVAGKTYTFRARLHVTADAVGGLKYTVAGTATATSVVWQQIAYNAATGAVVGSSRTATLGTTSNFITTTSDYITIDGSIVVNAGGTLVIQAAQQAANGTSSVLINSSLVVWGG